MTGVWLQLGCLSAVLMTLAGHAVSAAEQAERVGRLGEIERLVIRGAETFPAEALRAALADDFDVLLASAPDAPREPFLRLLAARLTDGYRKAGFADPQVSAAVDAAAGQVVIEIEEGRRYRAGGVRVVVAESISAADVVHVLTAPPPARPQGSEPKERERKIGPAKLKLRVDQDPLTNEDFKRWERGEWADFHADAAKIYKEAIQSALARQGFFYPTFRAEIRPDADPKAGQAGEASLHVLIDDEGPHATVGQVIVQGARRHTAEEIQDYLGIRAGQPVDARAVAAWQQQLRDSACFVEHEIRVFPAIGQGAPSDLLIRVLEAPNCPRLGEELTAADRVLVKWADWLSHWTEHGDEDFVVSIAAPQGSMAIVSSPRDGFLFDLRARELAPDVPVVGYSVIARETDVRLVSWHRDAVVRWPVTRSGRFQVNYFIRYQPDPADGTWKFLYRWWFGVVSARDGGQSDPPNQALWPIHFDFAPASAVALGRTEGVKTSWQGDRLTLRRQCDVIIIDATTGRLISWKNESGPGESEMIFALRPGEFARRAAEIDRLTAEFKPAIDPTRPISDHAVFLLAEVEEMLRLARRFGPARAESPDPAKKPCGNPSPLLRLLVERGALEPLDRWWLERAEHGKQEKDEFELPWPKDGKEIQIPGVNSALFGFGRVVARFVFGLHCRIVPRDSGPGQVGWNLGLLATGHVQPALANLDLLRQDRHTGPLTCWYAARLFGYVSPRFGRPFAETGLARLDTESFRQEVETLLPTDGRGYELMESFCRAAGSLTEADFERLAASGTSAEDLEQVRQMTAFARGQASGTGREAFVALLAAAWEANWKEQCRRDLERLTAPVQEKNPTKATVDLDSVLPDYRIGSGRKGDGGAASKEKKKDPFEHLSLDALLPSERPDTAKRSPLQFGIE